MSRIGAAFDRLNSEGRLAFMPYLTAGYPSLSLTEKLILAFADAGADIIELGFPFSDPLADGPTIQMSSQRALEQGVTSAGIIDLAAKVRDKIDCALVAMTYINPVHAIGYEQFAADLSAAGFDGLIVPDMPPEEGGDIISACEKNGLDNIFLAAPTSSDDRIRLAASSGSGFLYCVSLAGVTGARETLSEAAEPFLKRVRNLTSLPLALGFGVSKPSHIREVTGLVDGVIVGSAIIDKISACVGEDDKQLVQKVIEFAGPLIEAARGSSGP